MTRTNRSTWWGFFFGLTMAASGCLAVQAPIDDGSGDDGPDAGTIDNLDDDDNEIPDAGPRPDGRPEEGGQEKTLSQNSSTNVELGNSVSCSNNNFEHFETSFYRVFDLNQLGVSGQFDVTEVTFGVEVSAAGNNATQPVDIRLHTLSGTQLNTNNLTSIGQTTHQLLDVAGVVQAVPVTGTAPAGSVLVVEIHVADGRSNDYQFIIGSNNDGESASGYIHAPVCGDDQPETFASINEPGVHIIIGVTGNER